MVKQRKRVGDIRVGAAEEEEGGCLHHKEFNATLLSKSKVQKQSLSREKTVFVSRNLHVYVNKHVVPMLGSIN